MLSKLKEEAELKEQCMNAFRHEMNIVISQLKDKEQQLRDEYTSLTKAWEKLKEEKAKQDNSMYELV